MELVLGMLVGGTIGVLSVVASVLIVDHWHHPREIDAREVQRRIEGRGR